MLTSDGKSWAALPLKPGVTRDGTLRKIAGKVQYTKVLEWRSRQLSDAFRDRVVALVRASHPEDLDVAL